MDRDMVLLFTGAGIALASAILTTLTGHLLSLREDRIKRERDRADRLKPEVAVPWSVGGHDRLMSALLDLRRSAFKVEETAASVDDELHHLGGDFDDFESGMNLPRGKHDGLHRLVSDAKNMPYLVRNILGEPADSAIHETANVLATAERLLEESKHTRWAFQLWPMDKRARAESRLLDLEASLQVTASYALRVLSRIDQVIESAGAVDPRKLFELWEGPYAWWERADQAATAGAEDSIDEPRG